MRGEGSIMDDDRDTLLKLSREQVEASFREASEQSTKSSAPTEAKHKTYKQIVPELRQLGAVQYDLWLPESHVLPKVLHPNEKLKGIVYGRYRQEQADLVVIGRGALIATDKRVLLVDRKPLYMRVAAIKYEVISAVVYSKIGIMSTVTIHTRMAKSIHVRTFNQHCAKRFVQAIEDKLYAQPSKTPHTM